MHSSVGVCTQARLKTITLLGARGFACRYGAYSLGLLSGVATYRQQKQSPPPCKVVVAASTKEKFWNKQSEVGTQGGLYSLSAPTTPDEYRMVGIFSAAPSGATLITHSNRHAREVCKPRKYFMLSKQLHI